LWNIDLSVLVPLVLTAWVYLWGMRKVWARAGADHGITRRNYFCFFGALLALFIALVSPLEATSQELFSAHMVQHLILLMVAAPLLVLSDFPLAVLWALPRRRAQQLGQAWNQSRLVAQPRQIVGSPIFAWLAFAIAFWVWHAPALFEAALQNPALHALEHLVFLGAAVLFWWVLFRRNEPRHRRYGMAVLYLFATTLQTGILGALMTFTTQPWYAYYAPFTAAWGLMPLQDQQLAGLIMWFPGNAVFTLLTIGYFAAWLNALEKQNPRSLSHERLEMTDGDLGTD